MLWLTRNGDGERNILPSSTPPYSTALPHARDSHRYRVTQRHLLGMKRAQNKSLRPIPVFPTSKHLGLGLYILKGHSKDIVTSLNRFGNCTSYRLPAHNCHWSCKKTKPDWAQWMQCSISDTARYDGKKLHVFDQLAGNKPSHNASKGFRLLCIIANFSPLWMKIKHPDTENVVIHYVNIPGNIEKGHQDWE